MVWRRRDGRSLSLSLGLSLSLSLCLRLRLCLSLSLSLCLRLSLRLCLRLRLSSGGRLLLSGNLLLLHLTLLSKGRGLLGRHGDGAHALYGGRLRWSDLCVRVGVALRETAHDADAAYGTDRDAGRHGRAWLGLLHAEMGMLVVLNVRRGPRVGLR